jgi:signal transduction histidine kinase/ActR/RegA family two-component response regulator
MDPTRLATPVRERALTMHISGNLPMIPARILFWRVFPSCITFCLFLCLPSESLASGESRHEGKKNVLILNSYHQGYKWTDDETRGAIAGLDPVGNDFKVVIECMGTKWAYAEPYFEQLRSTYRYKFHGIRFDLIIAADDDAFNFLKRNRDELFPNTPVVFCGVNWFKPDSVPAGFKGYTGVNEDVDIPATLDLMLNIHPGTKHVYVIADMTTTGQKIHAQFAGIVPKYKGRVSFTFLDDMDMSEILDTVARLGNDSLVLMTIFQKDKSGAFYEFSESTRLISKSSRVPFYGLWDFNLGFGIVGGMLTSGFNQGKAAGEVALRILKGEKAEAIPVLMKSPNRFMFDSRQMARFGIKKSAIPRGSVVINEPASFHQIPNEVIWATLFGIASLSGMILTLLYVNRQRKRSEESLQKARDGLEMKVGERTRDLSELNEKLSEDIMLRRRTEEELQQANRELTREVEARKSAEEASQQSVSILRATIESTNDGILVVDKSGGIVDWNKRFLELWRIPDDLIASRDDDQALAYVLGQLTNPDEFMAKVKELYTQPEDESLDILRFKDGRIFERYSRPQQMNNEIVGRVWSFRDITERKKMEEEILKSHKLESLGVLAGGIAHDFNNLLTGIMGNVSLAKMFVKPEEKAFARLGEAEKACTLTKGLTQQLLTFAKGGAPVKKVESMTRIIMDSAGFVLRGSNVRCAFSLADDLWEVEVDGGQMSQVINNLIINADQAMPDGGKISIRAENITLGRNDNLPLPEGRYVHILIRDQGIGIPVEILPKIFDPYFTTKKKGSGLGLASVYSIVMNHKGYVGVESVPGSETTFHIYLPATDRRPAEETALPKLREQGKGRGRILVVDDEQVVRETAREILVHLGYQTDQCEDGTAALNLYREARESGIPYAFVFLDLTIPGGMGGKVTMKKLLEIDPDVKGVVTSGYSNDPILAHYREYGFCGVIVKPFTVEEIIAVLETLP